MQAKPKTSCRLNRSAFEKLFKATREAQCSWTYYESKSFRNKIRRAYEFLARHGHSPSMYFLADMLEEGSGTAKDRVTAAKWYRRAAESGYTDAMLSIALCYLRGKGVEQNARRAIYWFRRGALGRDSAAYVNLGDCYLHGRGVAKDPAIAFAWYRKAARSAHWFARLKVAEMYRKGLGVTQSSRWALHWYKRTPLPSAFYHVGIMKLGLGDADSAVLALNEAAQCGHVGAMRSLSICYALGRGVSKDPGAAKYWFDKARSSKRFSDLTWLAGTITADINDALEKPQR